MSDTVTRFKFFFAHQDEQLEAWLRSMAQQGLHLVNVSPLSFWTFRQGKPADVIYRADFPNSDQDSRSVQLMHDAGWTLAAKTVGWHYWCTNAVGGRVPELFSDNESKLRTLKNWLGVFIASVMPLFIIFVVTDKQRALDQLSMPFLVPLCLILVLYVLLVPYAVLQLLLRIHKLKNSLST